MITVLLNATAGGAGAPELPQAIATLCRAAGLEAEIIELQAGQDPTDAARRASKRTSIVVAAGGDGTVSGVAAGLLGTAATLGVLPIGSLNHFAKDLGIPLTLEKAVATIAAGHAVPVDVGRVNDRVFINNSSIGIYPNIVLAREELRRQGRRKWPAFVLATFRVLRRYRGVLVRIDVNGRRSVRRTPFVFVGNNEYTIEGIHLGGRVAIDRGRLFAYLAPRLRARDLPMLFVRALLGRSTKAGDFEIGSAPELWVDLPHARKISVSADGEIATMRTPLHYEISPGALKVLRPPV